MCQRIDPQFDPQDACGGLGVSAAESDLRQRVLEAASWDWGTNPPTQKELSSMVDCFLQQQLLQEQGGDPFFAAHVALANLPGAGTFLAAPPVAVIWI